MKDAPQEERQKNGDEAGCLQCAGLPCLHAPRPSTAAPEQGLPKRPSESETINDEGDCFWCYRVKEARPYMDALESRDVERLKRIAELREALTAVLNLFRDPSPFYIKKLGSPITNGDQALIDNAFIKAEATLPAPPAELDGKEKQG